MDRAQKSEAVAALKQTFEEVGVVVVTRNLGMSVAQSTALRGKMRDAGASFKVAKNTLTLIALEGTTYAPISDMLVGPTALATSTDPVAAAKVAVDFAKTNDKFEIVGGAMGDTLLDVMHPEDRGTFIQAIQGWNRVDPFGPMEVRIRSHGGELRHVELREHRAFEQEAQVPPFP